MRSTWAPTAGRSAWASGWWRRSARPRPGSRPNSVFLFTDNSDVFGKVDTRSQDPVFISENHLTHAFNPKWWGSVDLRWQYGGETQSDGVADDNLTNILGGGLTLGHTFNRHFSGYVSYGQILAKKGDAEERMIRGQLAYSF